MLACLLTFSLVLSSFLQSAAKCPFRLTFLVEPCAGPDAALATYERGLARWRAEQARAAAVAAAARAAAAFAHPHLAATQALSQTHALAPPSAFAVDANQVNLREGAHDTQLPAARRKALTLQFARVAARRVHRFLDPD